MLGCPLGLVGKKAEITLVEYGPCLGRSSVVHVIIEITLAP
jgi:hypothetical protein